jgi:hypothetical protein
MHIWMTVLGVLLYRWYPYAIKNGATWQLYCPGPLALKQPITYSASFPQMIPLDVTGWSQSLCLKANPIVDWTLQSYLLMVCYPLGIVFWLL